MPLTGSKTIATAAAQLVRSAQLKTIKMMSGRGTHNVVIMAIILHCTRVATASASLTSGDDGMHKPSPMRSTRNVTISNSLPRMDTTGAVVDAHSGNIVGPINGTYFLCAYIANACVHGRALDWASHFAISIDLAMTECVTVCTCERRREREMILRDHDQLLLPVHSSVPHPEIQFSPAHARERDSCVAFSCHSVSMYHCVMHTLA